MPRMEKYQSAIIVFYLLYNSLEANDIYDLRVENNRLIAKGTIPSFPEECSEVLEKFAQSAADFTLCSIKKAKPIRLCENCIDEYVNFTSYYQQIASTIVNGTSCRSYIVSQDRFDVVLEYHDHIMTVWNKGHCNDCFNFTKGIPTLSNNTKSFNKMAEETMNCIYSNVDPNNTDEVCVRCMQSYLKLNAFYGTLSKDSIGVDSICMDTVDLMNTTRSIWSKTLNCCKMRKSPEIIFLCCTAIISLLPLLYYLVVRYYGPIRDLPNILKESRFKQSILRSMQGNRVN